MPTFQFEAMDAKGQEIRDVVEAETQEAAQTLIRDMGYFVTKINVKKGRKQAEKKTADGKKRGFAMGGVKQLGRNIKDNRNLSKKGKIKNKEKEK